MRRAPLPGRAARRLEAAGKEGMGGQYGPGGIRSGQDPAAAAFRPGWRYGMMAPFCPRMINIIQPHDLAPEAARAAAQQVADKLARELDLSCQWHGDVLRFGKSGVEGTLTLLEKQAQMQIRLGFLYGAFAPAIQSKVAEKMRKVFAPE
jgi:putative polyhydroxyalkanoate system protein